VCARITAATLEPHHLEMRAALAIKLLQREGDPRRILLEEAACVTEARLMALAGLRENWRSPAGEWKRSFAIITTTPNG
jgi:hypothetical protein